MFRPVAAFVVLCGCASSFSGSVQLNGSRGGRMEVGGAAVDAPLPELVSLEADPRLSETELRLAWEKARPELSRCVALQHKERDRYVSLADSAMLDDVVRIDIGIERDWRDDTKRIVKIDSTPVLSDRWCVIQSFRRFFHTPPPLRDGGVPKARIVYRYRPTEAQRTQVREAIPKALGAICAAFGTPAAGQELEAFRRALVDLGRSPPDYGQAALRNLEATSEAVEHVNRADATAILAAGYFEVAEAFDARVECAAIARLLRNPR